MRTRLTARAAGPAWVAAAAGGVTAAVLASSVPAGAAVQGRELDLTFDGSVAMRSTASPALATTVVTRNGGTVKMVSGPKGGGAARLPAFKASSPPLAGLTVVDKDGVDDLDPGTRTFKFGAAFTLDATSSGSASDNGDNLVQRGLYGARSQYKLQVDHKHPSCRVKGKDGAVSVRSSRSVQADTWYRATCTREGSTVTLVVKRVSDGATWTYRGSGATGSMTPASRSLRLSIGVKVSGSGAIVASSSDQFNGRIDDVFLDIS